ncbi:MAG: hypothetical protein M1817_005235 [Caeruleum heppii]|nr:MAG: hypothetical protein M1817_005235 [Caeruleum heppii]
MSTFSHASTGEEVVTAFRDQIEGKTILITGPTPSPPSIGSHTALALAAANPHTIILAGRSVATLAPLLAEIRAINPRIRAKSVTLDLADTDAVRSCAREIVEDKEIDTVDVLINNAGVMALKEYEVTKQGVEKQFGVNWLGHWLFTNLLMKSGVLRLGGKEEGGKETARVVNVTSTAFEIGGVRLDDWNFENGRTYDPWLAYSQSKEANMLCSVGLAARYGSRGLRAFSAHPGVISGTNLATNVTPESFKDAWKLYQDVKGQGTTPTDPPKSLTQGTSTTLVAAFDPALTDSAKNGAFLRDGHVWALPEGSSAGDEGRAQKLWGVGEGIVGEKFEG